MDIHAQRSLSSFQSDTDLYNLVSINPRRKYYVPDAEISTFMEIHDALQAKHFVQVVSKTGASMIVVDIDIECCVEQLDTHAYTEAQLMSIVEVVQQTIEDVFLEPRTTCVVLEKPPYNVEFGWKSGVHLMFPEAFVNFDSYAIFARRLLTTWASSSICSELQNNETCNVKLDLPMDHFMGWLTYGSSKNEQSGTYELTKAYSFFENTTEEIDLGEYIESISDGKSVSETLLIFPLGRPLLTLLELPNRAVASPLEEEIARIEPDNMDRGYMEALTELLDPKRADIRDEWMRIGWILWNITNGSDFGFLLWDKFSQQSEKYTDGVTRMEWDRMKRGKYTIASLEKMAKDDSPDGFNALNETYIKERIFSEYFEGSDYDVASYFTLLYRDRVLCSFDKKEWFFFEYSNYNTHGYWVPSTVHRIKNEIVKTVLPIFTSHMREAYRFLSAHGSESKGRWIHHDGLDAATIKKFERFEGQYKGTKKVVGRISMDAGLTSISQMVGTLTLDVNKVIENFGTNPDVFCFENCVYDHTIRNVRPGIPEDYCVLKSKVVYKEFNANDPKLLRILQILKQIYPNQDIYNFALDRSAEVFVGGNKHKYFIIWTGEGNNGKSIIKTLHKLIFGEYAIDFPTSTIFAKRNDGASPDLARSDRGVRLAIVQESNADDKVNTGAVKELTGNDSIYARALYKNAIEFTPLFKLVLICNHLPVFNVDDPAFMNRVMIIPFDAKFVDNITPGTEAKFAANHIFPNDKSLSGQLKDLASAFAFLLIERLKGMDDQAKIVIPQVIKERIEGYRNDSDIVQRFYKEMVVMAAESFVSSMDMYRRYNEWAAIYCAQQRYQVTFESFNKRFKELHKLYDDQEKVWNHVVLRPFE